jgi:hypothetical protein
MPAYYCHECARKHNLIAPVLPVSGLVPASGTYSLEHFIKHTVPTKDYALNSVFNDPRWSTYQNYLVAGAASGCLQIDDQGRKNLVFFAGKETGLTFQSGAATISCSGVIVVCSETSGKIHAFPSSLAAESQVCALCGKRVPSHLVVD